MISVFETSTIDINVMFWWLKFVSFFALTSGNPGTNALSVLYNKYYKYKLS